MFTGMTSHRSADCPGLPWTAGLRTGRTSSRSVLWRSYRRNAGLRLGRRAFVRHCQYGLLPESSLPRCIQVSDSLQDTTMLVGLLAARCSVTPIDDIGKGETIGPLLAFSLFCIAG